MNPINGRMRFWMDTQDLIARKMGLDGIATVKPDLPFFREGTEIPMIRTACVFGGAGMGDFICWMPAIRWLTKNCPWIAGHLFVPKYFKEFAENVLGKTDWEVHDVSTLTKWAKKNPNTLFRGSVSIKNAGETVMPTHMMPNATGGHLVQCGYIFFAHYFPAPTPQDEMLPEIDFQFKDYGLFLPDAPKYFVFTPGSTAAARTVPGEYWKPIIEYVKSIGLTPVYLGKKEPMINWHIKFPDDLDYSDGIDLRDKTTMIQAAWIMKHAAGVVGLDNGLIHLAACTDASIVAGYNIVQPKDRRPTRSIGKWAELTVSTKELECAHCQTRMKSLNPHNFADCLYGDTACINILFEKSGARWIREIKNILR